MEEKKLLGFDAFNDLAIKFVEHQKGVWDQRAWADFLLDAQKAGFELSDDVKTYLGSVTKSMMKLYSAWGATKDIQVCTLDIFEQAARFFMETRGVFGPPEWEAFLKDLREKGNDLTNETRLYLEKIFEMASQVFTDLSSLTEKAESEDKSDKD